MKILIASSIHKSAIERLEAEHEVLCAFDAGEEKLRSLIADREVLILRSGVQINAAVLSAAKRLQLILRAGSGVDNIDIDFVKKTDIQLVRIPGPGAKAVAELSFALMLSLARHVLEADRKLREGRWTKHEMTGYLLTGKVLGIVGAGNIGTRTGQLGAAWGMRVLGCVEEPTAEKAERLAAKNIHLTHCDDLLAQADFLSIHVPLQPSTRYLIDARALSLMKQSAYLVNMARGGVVEEAALYDALVHNRLRGAALDVHEREGDGKVSPLATLSNVVLTPHIGAGTYDSQAEIGDIVVETVRAFKARQTESDFADERVVVQA